MIFMGVYTGNTGFDLAEDIRSYSDGWLAKLAAAVAAEQETRKQARVDTAKEEFLKALERLYEACPALTLYMYDGGVVDVKQVYNYCKDKFPQ